MSDFQGFSKKLENLTRYMWFDIITPTNFGGNPEHLKNEFFPQSDGFIEIILRVGWGFPKGARPLWVRVVKKS